MLWPNISTSRNLCILNRLKYVHKRIFVVALFIKQKIRERKKSQNSSLDQIWQRGNPKRSSSVPQNPKELENSKDMKGERGAVVYRKQKDRYRKKRQDQDRDTEERTGIQGGGRLQAQERGLKTSALSTARSRTSSLQDCEEIHFCRLKSQDVVFLYENPSNLIHVDWC